MKISVFITDDNDTNLMLAENALSQDFNVFTFSGGEKMLKFLPKLKPDLILLDVEMPEMDGFEVLDRIKQHYFSDHPEDPHSATPIQYPPVVFLTARTDEEVELEAFSKGITDFIMKPFSKVRLLRRVETLILNRELVTNLTKLVDERTKQLQTLQQHLIEMVVKIVEIRDVGTGGHIERVARYQGILFNAMLKDEYFKKQLKDINNNVLMVSSQLHDLGKIGIPDSILNKPAKLTQDEFAVIKEHVLIGEQLIGKIKDKTITNEFLESARIIISAHHEKWDGSGYPRQLKGEDIPIQGRIMAISDVYDALVSERPYKKPFAHEEAIEIIKQGMGTAFDPRVVNVFLKVADKFKELSEKGKI